jgi:hypothetical protein
VFRRGFHRQRSIPTGKRDALTNVIVSWFDDLEPRVLSSITQKFARGGMIRQFDRGGIGFPSIPATQNGFIQPIDWLVQRRKRTLNRSKYVTF